MAPVAPPAPPKPPAPPPPPAEPNFIVRFFTGGNTIVRVGLVILFFGLAFLVKYGVEHDMVPVENGGNISGADTGMLTIDPVGPADAGGYVFIALNTCGFATSQAATLTICPGDFNCDGALGSQDFFDFVTAFFNVEPGADFNRDGAVNSQDFFDFVTAFFAVC